MEEQQLIASLQKDDTRSFSLLLDTYQKPLYWHIRGIVKNHEDADDVLQNVFIKVYKSIKNFKGDSKLYTWLYRIATNESLTFLKKRAKQAQISSEELQDRIIENLESDVYFTGNDIQIALEKALTQLPEKQRLVFQMKYYQDMKYDDISEILGTSVGALKSSYHIATKKLTSILTSD
ncbi:MULTISPECIES: RNA polymerase sigma factor [Dokdonia]|uniref:RNA polymerase sigma factor n=1 Tax=Dokdonia TaxID=326319 RepID=UPI0035C7BAFB